MFGKDQDPEIGKNIQFPNNDPTKGGRKKSIRKELYKLLEKDGVVKFPKSQVVRIDEESGEVWIKVPTDQQIALKLSNLALSGNNSNTLRAMQMYMEQIDGRPTQPIEVGPIGSSEISPEERKERIKEMMRIMNGETD
jgi:hypothetical protein